MTDPEFERVPVDELLSKPYLRSRAELINLKKSTPVEHGNPANSSDTIYLSTADQWGNACSFIQSNYAGEYLVLSSAAFLGLPPDLQASAQAPSLPVADSPSRTAGRTSLWSRDTQTTSQEASGHTTPLSPRW